MGLCRFPAYIDHEVRVKRMAIEGGGVLLPTLFHKQPSAEGLRCLCPWPLPIQHLWSCQGPRGSDKPPGSTGYWWWEDT